MTESPLHPRVFAPERREYRYGPESEDHLIHALEDFRAADHRAGQAKVLNNLGWYNAIRGDRTALTHCQQALDLLKGTTDREVKTAPGTPTATPTINSASTTNLPTATARPLELYRDLGERFGDAETLTHLGDPHYAAAFRDRAVLPQLCDTPSPVVRTPSTTTWPCWPPA
ncbi:MULTISPECIES: hypothetical protein [unclassified Streptomyces]|uniref:hypothetical protein n=1 Tax=unclassified Streptomyces TaxID=2593676 RepID=UPI0036ECEC6F